MNDRFLSKPNQSIVDHIDQQGKLVFFLTNGKYVTFTEEEIGTNLKICLNTWSNLITEEPYRSKILAAGGTTNKHCIAKVIDRGNFIKTMSPNCFLLASNLTHVSLPELVDAYERSFSYCKLSCAYFPKLRLSDYGQHMCFFEECQNLVEVDLPGITDFHQAYNMFTNCKKLQIVKMNNLQTMTYNNSSIFPGCSSLKELHFPKLKSIAPYAGSMFSFAAEYLELLDLPSLQNVYSSSSIFASMKSCRRAILGRILLSEIKANNAWGLPAGCEVVGKDGRYTI